MIKQILTAQLDGFDYFLAIALGGLEAYWFDGGALGVIVYQLVAVLVFKTIKASIDRWFARTH